MSVFIACSPEVMIIFFDFMHGTCFDKGAIVSQKRSTQDKSTQWMINYASQKCCPLWPLGEGGPGPYWLSLISDFVYYDDLNSTHTHVDHSDVRPPLTHSQLSSHVRGGRGDVECEAEKESMDTNNNNTHTHTHNNKKNESKIGRCLCVEEEKKHGQRRDEMRRKKNLLNLVPFQPFISTPISHPMCKLHV